MRGPPRVQVLDELKRRYAGLVELLVVASPKPPRIEGSHPEIVERFHPASEDRSHLFVSPEIDTTDTPGSIVEVVIGRHLGVLEALVLDTSLVLNTRCVVRSMAV